MISPQAVVDPSVKIGNNVKIYPFAYIEKDVVIGDNCIIYPYVSIMEGTTIGAYNYVHQNTVLGAFPQDFDFKGEKTELVIGDHNIIRENVVINRATHKGHKTIIGNYNVLMEGVHISHGTIVGNDCVLGYGTKVAGNCEIHDHAILSSNVIANPRVRIGKGAVVQSGCRFSKDIPPYIVASHNPICYDGINSTILSRLEIDEKVQKHIANAYRLIFHGMTSTFDATQQVKEQVQSSPQIQDIIDFVNSSSLGIICK
ncbi:MAG: acyl-ACP--UDP-N-acetylglucosamine O-acyltransferase [Bacteroidaceae bacterium]|nr:acyl-ACP--UDP-N-acetylglucosamine O-acyltransferase [Bacteroidaceae bacterium]